MATLWMLLVRKHREGLPARLSTKKRRLRTGSEYDRLGYSSTSAVGSLSARGEVAPRCGAPDCVCVCVSRTLPPLFTPRFSPFRPLSHLVGNRQYTT